MVTYEQFHGTSILDYSDHAIGNAMSSLHFSHLVLDISFIVAVFLRPGW